MIPKVSVVIPLYNKEFHIKRTLNSVLSQTIQSFEIVVIDDGSTDEGAEVVKSFTDPRIRLIQQENAGVSAARNKGVLESESDLIAFLDADDEWKPKFLETILRLRKKFPEAGAYITAYEIYSKNDKILKPDYKSIPPAPWEGLLPNYFLLAALVDMPVSTSAISIPKKKIQEMGGFREDMWIWEDSDLWGKIALKYRIAFSWEAVSIYHQEADNRTCDKPLLLEEHPFKCTAIKKIRDGDVPIEILNYLQEYLNLLNINFAIRNIYVGNRKKALTILFHTKTRLLYQRKIMYMMLALLPSSTFYLLIKIKRFLENGSVPNFK